MKKSIYIVLCFLILLFTIDGKQMKGQTEEILSGSNKKEKIRIALTFDDGPNSQYTPLLLDGLKERKVKASFFLIGENIPGNEDIVKRMEEEGHLIGNHTYHHVELNKISLQKAKEEIEWTNNEIFEITGNYPEYMRPPFGAWKRDIELEVGMIPVFWDVDTLDWKNKNVEWIKNIIENQVKQDSIILMHDGYQSSVEAALLIMDEMLAKGYEFVTVDLFLTM